VGANENLKAGASFPTAGNMAIDVVRECNSTVISVSAVSSNVVFVTAGSGVQVVHTFTVTNNGPSECDGVVVRFDDNVLNVAGVTAVNGTGNITVSTNIGSEVVQTFTIVYNVASNAPAGGVITTQAQLVNTGAKRAVFSGPILSLSTVIDRLVQLSITKTASVDLVANNDHVVYTITVANNGPSDSSGVTVVDHCTASVPESGCTDPLSLLSGGPLAAGNSTSFTVTVNSTTAGFGVISNVARASGVNTANETTNAVSSATVQTSVAPLEPTLVFSAFRTRSTYDESDDDDGEHCSEREHSAERCTRLFFVELANTDANVRADNIVVQVAIGSVAISEALLTQSSRDDTVVNHGRGSFTWTIPTLQPGARSRIALKVRVSGVRQQITASVDSADACLPNDTAAFCALFPAATVAHYSLSKSF